MCVYVITPFKTHSNCLCTYILGIQLIWDDENDWLEIYRNAGMDWYYIRQFEDCVEQIDYFTE